MALTVPCPQDGTTTTNDEQVYNELLGVFHSDRTGQAWGPGNVPDPLVADLYINTRPNLLSCPAAAAYPGIDEPAPPDLTYLLAPRYDPVSVPMAVPPFDPPFSGDHLFNIHSDAANPGCLQTTPAVPDGECNFLFYTPGTSPVKCGCRRFWSSNVGPMTIGEAITADPYICMCSHHACYHDFQERPTAQAQGATPIPRGSKEITGREALTPLQDISFRFTPGLPSALELPGPDGAVRPTNPEGSVKAGLGLPPHDQTNPPPDGSLPDTLCWDDNRQSPNHTSPTSLPPIPSQCLMPSRPTSVADSSQSRYLRPFAGRGLQTLSGVRNGPKARQPLQERGVEMEPAMSKVVEEPPGNDIHPGGSQQDKTRSPGHNPSQDLGDTQPFGSYPGPAREALRNISDAIDAHEHRLDRLENVSFSVAGHEECSDKHDHMDLRVTELESRVEEVERGMNDNSSHATARVGRSDRFDGSTCSVVSDNTIATVRPLHSFEIRSQFQSIEAQLTKLQAALPASFETPWEVEVVFLPFPLRKIWQEGPEFKGEPSNGAADEWTQLPNTYSAATTRTQSPSGGEWARDHDFEWLLPKACGPKGLVDRRLRSRGLIRTISVKGPDARSVQTAMSSVFGGVMRDMGAAAHSRSRRRSSSSRTAQPLGLTNEWVPLRKIHKDSRLRFLSPAEMVTPTLWDVNFLNSVIMKSSAPRLFVTQPEAYVQDAHAYESGWTWRRLREIPRFYPEAGAPGEIPEADALEEHWAFNEELDEDYPGGSRSNTPAPPRHVKKQMSSSPSQQYFTTVESMLRSSTPSRAATPAATRARKRPPLPPIRTTSMPPSVPSFFSPSANRRVVSGGSGQERRVMATARAATNTGAITKRRQTRSPSRAGFTPRWSTKSPSPMIGAQGGVRSITPFNYATPYSNGPMEPHPAYGVEQYGGHGSGLDDDDFDIDIYDDGSFYDDDDDDDEEGEEDEDDGDGEGESVGSVTLMPRPLRGPNSHGAQLPEDEPWPGIEDRMSDGENVDPLGLELDQDGDSEMSSQPSEYPSTQIYNNGVGDDAAGFRIHEDERNDSDAA
ncbi:uncharacterized protein DNG_00837 [Cephalotrichum gorgonifer]|uniref:Uncharacterized protein n=1 Tax=Cephalotrichum gorgonifer TaxID=2041049 RepID=A0AAE8MPU6_9PEZI|nr:uncharacterized protein DNG_00837 [Cephalotrichum gorgonifer]